MPVSRKRKNRGKGKGAKAQKAKRAEHNRQVRLRQLQRGLSRLRANKGGIT